MTVEAQHAADPLYEVPKRLLDKNASPTPYVDSFEKYQAMWKQSVEDPDTFFSNVSSVPPRACI
jgi:acetyl-CoA synthetase